MKKIRLIALLMAMILCVAVFAGCKTPEEQTTGDTNEELTTENSDKKDVHPEIAKKDYGSEFYFTIMNHVNVPEYYWVKEPQNNSLSDAIYARQAYVKDYLGVEVYGISVGDPTTYTTGFQTAVKNQDDSIHMMISHTFTGIEGFITGNYFLDFNEIDTVDLSADYWKDEFMDELSVNGHLFLGYSSFNIFRTNVVAFNKDMFKLYEDEIGEDFYDMVSEYRWTIDKMISISDLIYTDILSDGKTADDTFGLVADYEVPYQSLLQACNINVVEQDERGEYKIAIYNEKNKAKTSDLVSKLYDLVRSDSAYFDPDPSYTAPAKIFTDGSSLMYLARTTALPGFLNEEINFGVLPYPMYDEMQKDVGYRSLQWGGYMCIPSYLKNPDQVYEVIEILSFASDDVNIAYYEKLLGKQVADAPKDKKMLDMVWDSICSDFGLTYKTVTSKDFNQIIPIVTKMGSTQNLASYVQANEAVANKRLRAFMASIK